MVDGPGVHTMSAFENVPPAAAKVARTSSLHRAHLSPAAITTDPVDPNSEDAAGFTDTNPYLSMARALSR
jgi:hypothetical protein